MPETIRLNDGTELEGHVFESEGVLFFYLTGEITLREAFDAMSDPEKTGAITAILYGMETVYRGYTDLYTISKDNYQVSGGLRRAVDTNV